MPSHPSTEIVSDPVIEGSVAGITLPQPEMRAVWLTTIYNLDWPATKASTLAKQEQQKKELIQLIDRLYKENYNTVFLQVRQRGELIYPNGMEPLATSMTGGANQYPDANYDPLQIAIEECHNRGMACHAWLVVFPIGNRNKQNSMGSQSLLRKHPDWCVISQNGVFLNPGLPQVRSYLSKLVKEMILRYNLDGIHLDYIRYPDAPSTFNDQATYKRYGKGMSKENWRRHNITQTILEIKETIDQHNPQVQLSAATLGRYRQLSSHPKIGWTCYESVYQDPKMWFELGIVDFITPMMYYKDNYFFPFLDDWHRTVAPLGKIVPGLGVYRMYDNSGWKLYDIEQQVKRVYELGFPGIAFYREEFVRPSYKAINQYIASLFTTPAINIPIPSPAIAIPLQPTITQITPVNANTIELHWQMPKQQKEEVTYNLYYRVYKPGDTSLSFRLLATGINLPHIRVQRAVLPAKERIDFIVVAANRRNITGLPSLPRSFQN